MNDQKVPGPKGRPFIGVIPAMARDPLSFMCKCAKRYGEVVKLPIGPKRFYLVNNPEYIKHILQENDRNFRKGYELTRPVVGNGLISSEGELWRKQRRLIQPAFHREKIASLVAAMATNIGEMLQRWQSRANPSAPVDMEAEMFRLTRHNLIKTIFSLELPEEIDRAGEAFEAGLEYLQQLMKAPFKLHALIPTPTNVRFWRSRKKIDHLIYAMLAARKDGNGKNGDLLDLLLNASADAAHDTMSDQQLRDEIMTLLMTGHETTASALAWTWYLLTRHPEEETRVVEEIKSVVGRRTPTAEDLPKLEYTGMVIDEVLRLYPSTWIFARQPLADFELGPYRIPRSAMVFLTPFIMHRHPDHWPAPETFQPQRFLPEARAERHPFAYFPFGGGPRYCIGDVLAKTIMKLVIVIVLQEFRLQQVAPDKEILPKPKATLRPGGPIEIRLEPR